MHRSTRIPAVVTLLLSLGSPAFAAEAPVRAGLRLLPPERHPDPDLGLRLFVTPADGAPLTASRADRIHVLTASRPLPDPDQWHPLDGIRALVDGRLRLDHQPTGAAAFFLARETPPPPVTVQDVAGIRAAVAAALPGTRILLQPGTYPGGLSFANLRGSAGLPIVLAAADPRNPPVIQGGTTGIQLTDPAFVELEDLVLTGATGNGLNIDDGGSFDTPAHHVILRRLRVTDVGPTGNRDGIKLSGVTDFRVEDCTLERWGTGGSGIDMVGCHAGVIERNLLRHLPSTANEGANGVQTKGGSRDVVIRRNRFEHAGSRSVNVGGSTGIAFFRPPLDAGTNHSEAANIRVEGNTLIGSGAAIAFVGVDGAVVRFNTIYRPQRWAIRILQETVAPGFVACRNGRFSDNIVAFHSSQWSSGGVNIGGNTAPATFTFSGNRWYCIDDPARSRPSLPVPETAGTHGQDPRFRDAEAGDLTLLPGSPAVGAGAGALPD